MSPEPVPAATQAIGGHGPAVSDGQYQQVLGSLLILMQALILCCSAQSRSVREVSSWEGEGKQAATDGLALSYLSCLQAAACKQIFLSWEE